MGTHITVFVWQMKGLQYETWIVIDEGPAFRRTFLLVYPSVDGDFGDLYNPNQHLAHSL